MCDCVEKTNEALQKKFGPTACLETKLMINLTTGKLMSVFPPLFFSYNELKADGKPRSKSTKWRIATNFCPMCGKENK